MSSINMESLSEHLINSVEKVLASREDRVLEVLLDFQRHVVNELLALRQLLKQHCLSSSKVTAENPKQPDFKLLPLMFENNSLNDGKLVDGYSQNFSMAEMECSTESSIDVFQKPTPNLQEQPFKKELLNNVYPSWLQISSTSDRSTFELNNKLSELSDENVESCSLSQPAPEVISTDAADNRCKKTVIYNKRKGVPKKIKKSYIKVSDKNSASPERSNNDAVDSNTNSGFEVPEELVDDATDSGYKCKFCKAIFEELKTFKAHLASHLPSKEKRYQCVICGKLFSSKSTVQKHVRLHNGVKPYKCETCGKSFSERFSLKRHLLIHTGEKPFECTICQKSFGRKDYRDLHMKLHWNNTLSKICASDSSNK